MSIIISTPAAASPVFGAPPSNLRQEGTAISDFFCAAAFEPVVSKEFLSQYINKQPAWGPIGYVTYKRTYARPLYASDLGLQDVDPDVVIRSEEFIETLERILNGLWHILRCHSARKNIDFDEQIAQRKAQKMFERMWSFKWLPPGRGLWMMGTKQMYLKGSAALNNCGFCSTANIEKEGSEPFAWAMDMSMLGVGVGFGTDGANTVRVKWPSNLADMDLSNGFPQGWEPNYTDIKTIAPIPRQEVKLGTNGSTVIRQETDSEFLQRIEAINSAFLPRDTTSSRYYMEVKPSGETTIQRMSMRMTSSHPNHKVFVIPDSREGWVESTAMVIDAFLKGKALPYFDYSLIRPKGTPIRGFGGTAEGPEFLQKCHENLVCFFLDRVGELLSASDIVDIFNEIGSCVVSGNVRRSAQIGLGDPNDQSFMALKHDPTNHPNCWNSNNSVYAQVGMDYTEIAKLIATRGEPGLLWLENVRKFGRLGEANWKDKDAVGTNPCVTAETWVQTKEGPRQVKDLVGVPFEALIHGQPHASTERGFFFTGTKDVYRLTTARGYTLDLTADHQVLVQSERKVKSTKEEWKAARDLQPGDEVVLHEHSFYRGWQGTGSFEEGWLLGELLGDGHFTKDSAKLEFWGDSASVMLEHALDSLHSHVPGRSDRTGTAVLSRDLRSTGSTGLRKLARSYGLETKQISPKIEQASSEFARGFMRGWFDADGSIQGCLEKGHSVRLSSTNQQNLIAAQRILLRLGIASTIYHRKAAGHTQLPDGKGSYVSYPTQDLYELVISGNMIARYDTLIGFQEPAKVQKLRTVLHSYRRSLNKETFTAPFVSLELIGRDIPVYDCTIPGPSAFDANGLYVHNCAEQSLHNYELCCLVENFPSLHEDEEDFLRTLKQSYLYAKAVTLVPSHSKRTNKVMGKNSRIGCSLSGIQDARLKFGTREFLAMCDKGYQFILALDQNYSDWLQVRQSIKKTSIKPSGTVSLLAGVKPGIHHATANYRFKNMRFSASNYMVPILAAAGYRVFPAPEQPESTVCVAFPCKEQFESITEAEAAENIWEQLEFVAALQESWADNQVSVTIKFKNHSGTEAEIKRSLELYETRLKSISFLPYWDAGQQGAYEALPEQPITKEEYEHAISGLKPYTFSSFVDDLAIESCDSGVCPVR